MPRVSFTEEQVEWLDELFEWIVPSCLGQIEKCELFAPFSEAHLVRSMLNLFKALVNLESLIANQNSEAPIQVDTIHIQMVFIYFKNHYHNSQF